MQENCLLEKVLLLPSLNRGNNSWIIHKGIMQNIHLWRKLEKYTWNWIPTNRHHPQNEIDYVQMEEIKGIYCSVII